MSYSDYPLEYLGNGLLYCTPLQEIMEEITLERDVTVEKKILAKLSVKRRNPDNVYFGELYLDHDYREGSEGSSCK